MGLFDDVKNGEFQGIKRAFGGGKHSQDPSGGERGVVGGGAARARSGLSAGGFFATDEDGTSPLNIGLRVLQSFLPFVNLCIYIGVAAFQGKWKVGPSGLTDLGLFFNAQSLLHGFLFLGTPLLSDKLLFLKGIARGLRQVRIGVIINAAQAGFMLIMALATTISAYTGGCKDAASDPNADLKGYTDAMGPFCRNKRAGAAFFWLNFLAWSATLGLVILYWYRIRRNPTSAGFKIPGAQFPEDDEAAFAHSSDAEAEEPPSTAYPLDRDGNGGYRPSGDYYTGEGEGGLFAEGAPTGYGDERYRHPGVTDPFADQERYGEGGGGGGGEEEDPYSAIRKSMDASRAQPNYSTY